MNKRYWETGTAVSVCTAAVVFFAHIPARDTIGEPVIILDQGLGMGINAEDGIRYPTDCLVSDRATGIYVEISDQTDRQEFFTNAHLTISGNGTTYEFYPEQYETDILVSFTKTPCYWEEGTYEVSLKMDKDIIEQTTVFRDMDEIRVLAVPVKGYYESGTQEVPKEQLQLDGFTRKVYPLGREDLEWNNTEQALSLDTQAYNLDTAIGRYRVWKALGVLQEESEEDYDLIIGIVAHNMYPDKDSVAASITGFTFGGNVSVISLEDTSPEVAVAHEIGHCYLLGDEYENGTASPDRNRIPFGMSGKSLLNPNETIRGAFPALVGGRGDAAQSTGVVITQDQYPFDIETGELISREMTSFMGLSGYAEEEYWVTTDIWEVMYKTLSERKEEGQNGF